MKQVPFFANTADGTYCVQAAFKMMLKYFMPARDFSFRRLDEMSRKQPGKGTWWSPILIEIRKMGILVKAIENFDYQRFYADGPNYVKAVYPAESAEYHLNKTNLIGIKASIPEYLRTIDIERRPATAADIDKLLAGGWLVGLGVNSRVLNDKPGFSGHVIVVFDTDKQYYWLHDPGPPAKQNMKISRAKLLEAAQSAGKQNVALVALKN